MFQVQPDGFPHPPLDTVPDHSRTHSARNGEPDPWAAGFQFPGAECHKE
jgi:hypothetical protein